MKSFVVFLALVSASSAAVASSPSLDSFAKEATVEKIKTMEAVCKYENRCGFKTACNFACLFVSTAPVGKWWKAAAVQKMGQWCGDLCEKVQECKFGYYCDAY